MKPGAHRGKPKSVFVRPLGFWADMKFAVITPCTCMCFQKSLGRIKRLTEGIELISLRLWPPAALPPKHWAPPEAGTRRAARTSSPRACLGKVLPRHQARVSVLCWWSLPLTHAIL